MHVSRKHGLCDDLIYWQCLRRYRQLFLFSYTFLWLGWQTHDIWTTVPQHPVRTIRKQHETIAVIYRRV